MHAKHFLRMPTHGSYVATAHASWVYISDCSARPRCATRNVRCLSSTRIVSIYDNLIPVLSVLSAYGTSVCFQRTLTV